MSLTVIFNGRPIEMKANSTLEQAILIKTKHPVLVELNGELIEIPRRNLIYLKNKDTIKVFQFAGGG
jgi:thiamine biosynthesis protein ThiS